jgi:diguanylate cyclase (GGDEF)-like protein
VDAAERTDRAAGESGTGAGGIFDALPSPTVVVDADGRIVAVNEAWRAASDAHGADAERTGLGADYLAVCEQAAASGDLVAERARRGIGSVLAGDVRRFQLDVPCPTGRTVRWYHMDVAPLPAGGAVIQHVEITRRKRLEHRLAHLAGHDPLTGALTRAALEQDLERLLARTDGPGVVALSVALEGFSAVNHELGPTGGDSVLTQVVNRIRHAVRPDDTVARVGGDEFVVVVDGDDPQTMLALTMSTRLADHLDHPYRVGDRVIHVEVSVGSTTAEPGDDAGAVLERAARSRRPATTPARD